MTVPEHLWRFPTAAAIASLARRFDLPNTPEMQDWECEVADPARLDELLAAYDGGELDDDERFTLMETIIQSFEDSDADPDADPRWAGVLERLDSNIELHIYTVWYWADPDEPEESEWRVRSSLRELLKAHRDRFEASPR